MGLKEADESKLLSRLEKLGRDVSALRWSLTLSSHNKRLPLRAEQAKLNSGLDVCLGKADNLGIAPNTFLAVQDSSIGDIVTQSVTLFDSIR